LIDETFISELVLVIVLVIVIVIVLLIETGHTIKRAKNNEPGRFGEPVP
jgi:hypothetical protein